MIETTETLDQPEIFEKKPRRTFLIALAVITFVNAAVRIIVGVVLFSLIGRNTGNVSPDQGWLILFAYALLFSALVNVIGAILMLLRKRIGIWIYSLGQISFLIGAFAYLSLVGRYVFEDSNPLVFILLAMFILPVVNTLLYLLALKKSRAVTIHSAGNSL